MSIIISDVVLPDEFLMAQENRRIVYFVGAGVSCNVGLPSAEDLLKEVEESLGIKSDPSNELLKRGYEFYYEKLQNRFPNLKKKVEEFLIPGNFSVENLELHKALLNLSYDKEGNIRIVTTNFDDVFRQTVKQIGLLSPCYYSAPLLPLDGNWHGIVHLHGRFPFKDEGNAEREKLTTILTQSDYGAAYMTNGYASRFLVDLFQRYTVCFVGYSADENVIRYILSAIASDSSQCELKKPIFAIDTYKEEKNRLEKHNKWTDQNVVPIFIENSSGDFRKHTDFFIKWSEFVKDNIEARKEYALSEMKQGYNANIAFLSWALCDEKTVNEILSQTPASLEDVNAFIKILRFRDLSCRQKYLSAFSKILFSTQYTFSLFYLENNLDKGTSLYEVLNETEVSRIAHIMAKWLAHFVKNEEFIKFVVDAYPNISQPLLYELQNAIYKTHWADDEKDKERLWHYILKYALQDFSLYIIDAQSEAFSNVWGRDLLNEDASLSNCQNLKEMLTLYYRPCVKINEGKLDVSGIVKFPHFRHPQEFFEKYLPKANGQKETPSRWLPLFEDILLDISERMDKLNPLVSLWEVGKICRLIRKKELDTDWTFLICLLRQAWFTKAQESPINALEILYKWMNTSYPIFHFLAFYAINSAASTVPTKEVLQWLLKDNCRILLNIEYSDEIDMFIESRQSEFVESTELRKIFTYGVVQFYEVNNKDCIFKYDMKLLIQYFKIIFGDEKPDAFYFISKDDFQKVSIHKIKHQDKLKVKWIKSIGGMEDFNHCSNEEIVNYFIVPREEELDWELGECYKSQQELWRELLKGPEKIDVILTILSKCKDRELLTGYRKLLFQDFDNAHTALWEYIFSTGVEDLEGVLDEVLKLVTRLLISGIKLDVSQVLSFVQDVYIIECGKEFTIEEYSAYKVLNSPLALLVPILQILAENSVLGAQDLLKSMLTFECKNLAGRCGVIHLLQSFHTLDANWVKTEICPLLKYKGDLDVKKLYWKCFLLNTENRGRIKDLLVDFLEVVDCLSPTFEKDFYLHYLFNLGLSDEDEEVKKFACFKIKKLLIEGTYSNRLINWLMSEENQDMPKDVMYRFFFSVFPQNAYEKVEIENVVDFIFCFDSNEDAILNFFMENKLIHFDYSRFLNTINHCYRRKMLNFARENPDVFYEFIWQIYDSNLLPSGYDLRLLEECFKTACEMHIQLNNAHGYNLIMGWLRKSNSNYRV